RRAPPPRGPRPQRRQARPRRAAAPAPVVRRRGGAYDGGAGGRSGRGRPAIVFAGAPLAYGDRARTAGPGAVVRDWLQGFSREVDRARRAGVPEAPPAPHEPLELGSLARGGRRADVPLPPHQEARN